MAMRTPIESGVPDNKQYLHPLMLKNYGNWKWHDRPRPGVLHHVAHNGDEIWTVRAGTQRQMDVYTIRKLCDIADTYADGHVRFTIRSNIEFMVADPNKVAPLIEALQSSGFPVGGTGNSVSMIAHTQGWLHCDIPGTDASGAVKAESWSASWSVWRTSRSRRSSSNWASATAWRSTGSSTAMWMHSTRARPCANCRCQTPRSLR